MADNESTPVQKIFYARVSSKDQDLAVQEAEAKKVGADKVFREKASGVDGDRPALRECLDHVRVGDTLYVMRADRLGRSTLHLLQTIQTLKDKGVEVVFTKQPELSTNTPQGELMLTIMAAIAKFETELRAERQAEGIAKAREKGIKFGRKPKLTDDMKAKVRELREQHGIADIVALTGLSRASVYRALD